MSMLMLQRARSKHDDATQNYTIVCAWCGRERHQHGWRKVRFPRLAKRADVSHGICPDCYERQMAKLHTNER